MSIDINIDLTDEEVTEVMKTLELIEVLSNVTNNKYSTNKRV